MNISKDNIKSPYEEGGVLGNWGNRRTPEEITKNIKPVTKLILEEIRLPRIDHEKVKILSPSANNASTEVEMQRLLGSDFRIVSGDIASIHPKKRAELYYRGDAEFLPFKSRSFSMIYDRQGAAWHQAMSSKAGLRRLFEEYNRVLLTDGLVVLDKGTHILINNLFGKKFKFSGFTEFQKHVVGKPENSREIFTISKVN